MKIGVEMSQFSRVECGTSFQDFRCRSPKADESFFNLSPAISACSKELRPALAKIQAVFPELLRVMHLVIGGSIQVSIVQADFLARWDFGLKEIWIGRKHFNKDQEYGPIMDLLFEMQNACYTELFIMAKKKAPQLSVQEYVRKIEEIEWNTCKLTCARLESLSEEDFPREINDLLNTYVEDFELYYLHQQASGHSYVIADRYRWIPGVKNLRSYEGTWKRPFGRDDRSGKILYELLILHLTAIRTGHGEETLREKIRIIESYAQDEKWAEDVLVNLKWFSEKFEASPHYSNREIPLYKPDRDKLELLGIFD